MDTLWRRFAASYREPARGSLSGMPARSAFAFALGLVCLAACSVDVSTPAGTDPPAPSPADPVATPPTPPAPVEEPPLAQTQMPRELRGAWISSVWNGTWPSRTGMTPAQAEAELTALLDAMAAAKMNAAFLQVRPESDALYASTLEPWSRFLTGTQGGDPGFDPLSLAIRLAHARGIELHAWLNPFRGMTSTTATTAQNHVTRALPGAAKRWGSQVWMDPGSAEVRAHGLAVIRDLLRRYDIDGLHFDDYFYPYPIAGQTFPDDDTFNAYTSNGGALSRDDWRRENVDGFVRDVGVLVRAERPDVRFGVSPFGIWRPGHPAGISGLDAYATIYCDAPKWMAEGWVDYLAPQLYWPTTQAAQAFGKLLDWWATKSTGGRHIFAGHDLTKIGTGAFTPAEYEAELGLTRAASGRGVAGSILFTAGPIVTDASGARSRVLANAWPSLRMTPPMPGAGEPPPAPLAARDGDDVTVSIPVDVRARGVVVYDAVPGGFRVADVIPAASLPARVRRAPLAGISRGEPASRVISIVDRRGVEGPGLRVD